MRKCYICNVKKDFDDFHKDKTQVGGISYDCKKCKSEKRKEQREKNPEKYREQARKSLEKNYDSIRESQRRFKIRNRDRILKRRRELRESRKTEMNARESERRKKHIRENTELAKKQRAKQKEYYKRNKEKIIPQRNAHKLVMYAIRLGVLTKPSSCEVCGSTIRIEGHHMDYSKPLEVRWLCKVCHVKEHKEQ